jgi:hypothetical protein
MAIVRDRAFVDAPLDRRIPNDALMNDGNYTEVVNVTPSDTLHLAPNNGVPAPCSAIFVGTAGNINGIMAGETTAKVVAYAAGWHKVSYRRINATNTTASGIRAYW